MLPCRLHVLGQPAQPLLPEHPILRDPCVDVAEGVSTKSADALSAVLPFRHEARLTQDAEVFGNRRATDGKLARDISNTSFAASQPIQDRATRWIC